MATSSWHLEQVATTCVGYTLDSGSVGLRMLCSPWQFVHTGASLKPLSTAQPWMLFSNSAYIFLWHLPHVLGTCSLLTVDIGSAAALIVWAPWQSVHTAAASSPCPL